MHVNNAECPGCEKVLNRFPGLVPELRTWFLALRSLSPEAHCSCAGRGRADQEDCFARGTSRAHYGQSAHNVNAALDLFELRNGKLMYDRPWFLRVVAPAIPPHLDWYGAPGAAFPELPHVEVRGWRERVKRGELAFVEP